MSIDGHRGFIADTLRVEKFRQALAQVVRPGAVVADIGTGTGILALLACEAGAARVYAVERGPIIGLAREIAAANGWADRIHFVRAASASAAIPEPVDVVVADLIGPFAFEPGLFDVLADARARYLKPDGHTVPSRITLHVAAAESASLRAELDFWRGRPAGLDMTAAYERARKTVHNQFLPPHALITPPAGAGSHALPTTGVPAIRVDARVRATRDGVIDALAGWFDAELAPGVSITNAPDRPDRINRRLLLLPVSPGISVSAGDAVEFSLRLKPHTWVYRWQVRHASAAGELRTFDGSTFEGLLLSREDLTRVDA